MIRLFLVLLLLPSLAFAQKRGLVDRSGRVLVELPDSLDTPVLKSSVYGQLRVVRDLPDADYGKKRLDEDDQPVDLMSLIGLPDTVVVDKNQVNLKLSIEGGKGGRDPDSLFGIWYVEPADSSARAHEIYDKGTTRGDNYSNVRIAIRHPGGKAEGVGKLLITGPWTPAESFVRYDLLRRGIDAGGGR